MIRRSFSAPVGRTMQGALLAICSVLGWLAVPGSAAADTLAECRALSTIDDDIHACLDNFLDDLDDSVEVVVEQVAAEIDEESRALFGRSQTAFTNYRRQNCLWYVAFSDPRPVAEQLGKNCLIDMTRSRLAELRGLLVASEQSKGTLKGYYVFGPDLNTFIGCGAGGRYWVQSETRVAADLQQRYGELASTDRQLLYTELQGKLVEEPSERQGHRGSADISGVGALRMPLESDCQLPKSTEVSTAVVATDAPADDENEAAAEADAVENAAQDEPEQELRAYFGQWEAACRQQSDTFRCELIAGLGGDPNSPAAGTTPARLVVGAR